MRENRPSGLEGGAGFIPRSYPYLASGNFVRGARRLALRMESRLQPAQRWNRKSVRPDFTLQHVGRLTG